MGQKPQIDFSQYADKPQIDFSHYAAPETTAEPEKEGVASRFLQGTGQSLNAMLKSPYGITQPPLPPVDVNNPPQVKWDMPKSMGEFASRFFGPMGQDLLNFGKGFTDYEDWHSGDYAKALGATAMNLLGLYAGKKAATGGSTPATPENPYPMERAVSGAEGKYSKAGNALASQLPAVQGADVPAVAHSSVPLLREAAADLGLSEAAWSRGAKMNGPAFMKATVDHAVDLMKQRVNQVLAPIRQDTVDPQLFQKTPELAAQFDLTKPVTYDMIDQARQEANAQLTRGNYYMKPLSKQLAANEPTIDALRTAQQARYLLYKAAGDATGIDVRPLQAAESNLITLSDAVTKANETLSRAEAIHETTPLYQKLPVSRMFVSAKGAGAVLSESALKAQQMFRPTSEFNRAMRMVFEGLEPELADTGMNVHAPAQGFVPPLRGQLPPRTLVTPQPEYPALPPGGRPSDYFPQTQIQGTPHGLFQPPDLFLGKGTPALYVEPNALTAPNRLLSRRSVPATRYVKPLSIEETK